MSHARLWYMFKELKGVKSRETKIYFYKFDVLWKHIGTFRTQNLLHKDCSAREPRSGICAA